MKYPLFLKIFFSVCLAFLIGTHIVWLVDSILQTNPSREAERTAHLALAGLSSTIRLGGEKALRDQLANWPALERRHLTYHRTDAVSPPPQDPLHGLFTAIAADPKGHRYAFSYSVRRFDGFVSPPLVFDMGPHVFFGSFLGILVFSGILALYLTAPITKIRAGFRRLAAGDLKFRLAPILLHRRDEIADMASDFNKMAVRLEELVASRDRLLADISHELRSPLARLHLAIALARQSPGKMLQSFERIGREAEKLDEMVGELLALSKLESGITPSVEYFFVSEIVSLVVEDAQFEAQEMGIRIELATNSDRRGYEALVKGSGKLVSRAIENIVRNALRFSRRGDSVAIELDSSSAGTSLYIRDRGPGVNVEQLTSLFEPFVQGDNTNGQGYGLGLAIAKRAIVMHGGTIRATNGAQAGLTIAIWLPAAPDSHEESKFIRDRSALHAPV